MTTSARGQGGSRAVQRAAPARAGRRPQRPRGLGARRLTSRTKMSACGRAELLQRGDGGRRGSAAAQDDGGGRGDGTGVAERVDDSGDVGVVADQTDGSGVRSRRPAARTRRCSPRRGSRATPRTSSTSPTMADFSGMVTDSPRQLGPSCTSFRTRGHKGRQRRPRSRRWPRSPAPHPGGRRRPGAGPGTSNG